MKDAKLKRLHTTQFQSYDILEKTNYGDSKRISGCQGSGEGRGYTGRAQRISRAENLFFTVIQWWIHVIIHLSKPIECRTPVNLNVNCGLWMIMMSV